MTYGSIEVVSVTKWVGVLFEVCDCSNCMLVESVTTSGHVDSVVESCLLWWLVGRLCYWILVVVTVYWKCGLD